MCADCGCCQAKVYAGDDAICWACDAGQHPTGRIEPSKVAVDVPPIRLQPAAKFEVREEAVNVKGTSGTRIPDEIRAKIVAEPETVGNRAVAEKYGVNYGAVWGIRKKAGINPVRETGCRTGKKSHAPAAEHKKHIVRHAHESKPVHVAHSEEYRFSITVQIGEAEADLYWSRLTPEQKAATIGLQMQAIIDDRVAPRG
jgi:hypothetical protein